MTERTDQFPKILKTLARKYEFLKKIKKCDLNQKIMIFSNPEFQFRIH